MLVTWHSASPFNRFFNSLELTLFNIFVFHILCITVSILQSAFLEIRVYDGYAATHQQGKKKKRKKMHILEHCRYHQPLPPIVCNFQKKNQKKNPQKNTQTHARMHKLCNVSNFLYLNCFDNMFRKNQITKNE